MMPVMMMVAAAVAKKGAKQRGEQEDGNDGAPQQEGRLPDLPKKTFSQHGMVHVNWRRVAPVQAGPSLSVPSSPSFSRVMFSRCMR